MNLILRCCVMASLVAALTGCARRHEGAPPGREGFFPLPACLSVDACTSTDASTTAVCLLWSPATTRWGLCTESCTAWTETELTAALTTADRVCLGWNGMNFDPSLAGTDAGRVLVPCRVDDPAYTNVTCDEATYGGTTVRLYRPW